MPIENVVSGIPSSSSTGSGGDISARLTENLNKWIRDPQAGGNKQEAANRIFCAFQNKATTLQLNDLGLTLLPSALGALTKLKTLCLENNELASLPPAIGRLTKLKEIDLENNKLTSLSSRIESLAKLVWLNLENNKLSSLPPEIGCLENLEKLYLRKNELKSLPPEVGQLAKLELIDVNDNPNLSILPIALSDAANLTSIDCDEQIKAQADRILAACEANQSEEFARKLRMKLGLYLFYAGQSSKTATAWLEKWPQKQQPHIHEWLQRLSMTRDFQHRQRALATVVCSMLQSTTLNPPFAESFFTQISFNNACCQDRAAMGLNELYVDWRITCDRGIKEKEQLILLLRAAKTFALRTEIAKHILAQECLRYADLVEQYCKKNRLSSLEAIPLEKDRKAVQDQIKEDAAEEESVEIFLYYENHLRAQLSLLTLICETTYAADIGQREWISKGDLIGAVNANYPDFVIGLAAFETLVKKDLEVVQKLQEAEEDARAAMEQAADEAASTECLRVLTDTQNAIKKTWFLERCRKHGIAEKVSTK